MKTVFFQSRQFRLFLIFIIAIIVIALFCISAFSYYYNYYKEVWDYKAYLNSLLSQKLASLQKGPELNVLDPQKGNSRSKIIIYLYSDYFLPASKEADALMNDIYNYYGSNNLLLVWKDFSIMNVTANKEAALAAHCANNQGAFESYRQALFAQQSLPTKETYINLARDLKLDTAAFNACTENKVFIDFIDNSYNTANSLGLSNIPVIYVNTTKVENNLTFNNLKFIIDNVQ